MLLLLHKRRSVLDTNTVTDAEGVTLGRVFPCSKIAAGTGGERRRFWTAEACWPGEPRVRMAPSLGTRYTTRAQAINALRDFHVSYPLPVLEAKREAFPAEPHRLNVWDHDDRNSERSERYRMGRALSWAVVRWRNERRAAHPFNAPASSRVSA
jgi:hypothetical protein